MSRSRRHTITRTAVVSGMVLALAGAGAGEVVAIPSDSTSCRIAPFEFTDVGVRDATGVNYDASGATTLDCPEGHRMDRRPVRIGQRGWLLGSDGGVGELTDRGGDVRGQAATVIDLDESDRVLSARGRLAGDVVDNGDGTAAVSLEFTAHDDAVAITMTITGTWRDAEREWIALGVADGAITGSKLSS